MDSACLKHCLTEAERTKFERDGFIVIDNALPSSMVEDLIEAVDSVKPGVDFIGKDDRFLELIDWHRTLPKVWGILGWNIHLYHTHITVHAAGAVGRSPLKEASALASGQWAREFGH